MFQIFIKIVAKIYIFIMAFKRSPGNKQPYQFSQHDLIWKQITNSKKLALKNENSQKNVINKNQNIKAPVDIQVLVRLKEGDQLQVSFIQSFIKYVTNSHDMTIFSRIPQIQYFDFCNLINRLQNSDTIKNYWDETIRGRYLMEKQIPKTIQIPRIKSSQNMRKGSFDRISSSQKTYQFSFLAQKNSIIFLLDLSPYMLIYDASTKSFPLKNIEQIIMNLMQGLQWHHLERKKENFESKYKISVYGFSTQYQKLVQFIKDQELIFKDKYNQGQSNIDKIQNYINLCISRCKLPYLSGNIKLHLNSFIQEVLNEEEGNSMIKSILIISTFQDFDNDARIFFSSSWYTFAFICTGSLNFATYIIEDAEIADRFPTNPYFKTKYIYRCQFLQNWQKIQMIEKKMMVTKYLTTATKKHRSILYLSQGVKKQTIFEDVLSFKLNVEPSKKHKFEFPKAAQSYSASFVTAQIKHQEKFDIPQSNISDILRTKYLQGWEHLTQQGGYYENTKFDFRLDLGNRKAIFYIAKRNGRIFNARIFLAESLGQHYAVNEEITKQKLDLMELIRKIDLINTTNFQLINKDNSQVRKQKGIYSGNIKKQGEEVDLLRFIFDKHEIWNRFFKVKRIYLQLSPNFNTHVLAELLFEISYFIGQRVFNLCYMKPKKDKREYSDGIQLKQSISCSTAFTKINCQFNILELKIAFLKYQEAEIKVFLKNLIGRLHFLKLNYSTLKIVPSDLFKFCHQKFKIEAQGIFKKCWKISFMNQKGIFNMYKSYNATLIKRLGYQLLKCKNFHFYYYKIIRFVNINNKSYEKAIFVTIKIDNNERRLDYQISAFPDLCLITKITEDYRAQIINEKGSLSFSDLFEVIVDELKQVQKKSLSLIKNYSQIYHKLSKTSEKQIKNQISKAHMRRSANRIINIQPSINIDQIPPPQIFLMESQITSIKGDLIIHSAKFPEKYYVFFNVNDTILIYLWQKKKQINYRCVSIKYLASSDNIAQDLSLQGVQNNFFDAEMQKIEIKKIKEKICMQQREEKYKKLYEAVSNSQNIETITKYLQNLKDFYQPKLDFSEIISIIRKTKYSHITHRFASILAEFHRYFFSFLQIFFDKSQNNSYFSEKKQPMFPEEYLKLKIKASQNFNNLIMKIQFEQNAMNNQESLSCQNLVNIFLESSRRPQISLKFYSFTISLQKIEYITNYLRKMIKQCVMLLNLVTVTQDNGIKSLQKFISSQNQIDLIHKKIKLPEELIHSYSQFVRYIELLNTNSFLDFHIINDDFEPDKKQSIDLTLSRKIIQTKARFIANEQQFMSYKPGEKINASFKLCLKYWVLLEINKNENLIHIYFLNFQCISLSNSLNRGEYIPSISSQTQKYVNLIIKAVKIHNVFKNIEKNLMFPTESPVPIYINEINFLKMENKKKKESKYQVPMPKKYRAKQPNTSKQVVESFSTETKLTPDPNTFYLKMIYEQIIEFYSKFKPGQLLDSLVHSQKLNSNVIRNLENTYIFLDQEIRQYFFFYLQEVPRGQQTPKLKGSFKQQSNSNLLKFSVYCIDECFKKSQKYLNHAKLIKKALQEVTFNLIATDINLRLAPCLLDSQQEEYFKSGETWSLTINLPYISEKNNFRQYLKQHLEAQFHHKRTQFRSMAKKSQCAHQKKQTLGTCRPCSNNIQSNNDLPLEISNEENYKQKQCTPSMWIFNTLKQREMHVNFGMCIYLMKIDIQYSHSIASNADLWKRYTKNNNIKTYIYPDFKNNYHSLAKDRSGNQSQSSFQANEWKQSTSILHQLQKWNYGAQNQSNLDQSRYKQDQEVIKDMAHSSHPDQSVFTTVNFKILSYFGSPKFNKLQKAYKEFLFCSLYDYWFENYCFCALGLMSFKSELKKNTNNSIKPKQSYIEDQQMQDLTSPVIKRIESSPQKYCLPGLIEPIQFHKIQNCFQMLLNVREFVELSQKIDASKSINIDSSNNRYQKSSPCLYVYSSYLRHQLIIQEKFDFLHKFIENFIKVLQKVANKYIIPLLIYGKVKDQYIIWEIQYFAGKNKNQARQASMSFINPSAQFDNINKSNLSFHSVNATESDKGSHIEDSFYGCIEKIQNYFIANQIQPDKIGVLFLDYLADFHSIRINKADNNEEKHQKQGIKNYFVSNLYNSQDVNIEFDTLKYFKEGQSFCQNQYLFKRSLFMKFQFSTDGFSLFTYNFNHSRQFLELKYYLYTMEQWFFEKNRLLQFITSIKNNEKDSSDNYIMPTRMKTNHELLDELKQEFVELRTIGVNRMQINSEVLTKLLIQLVCEKNPTDFFFKYRDCLDYVYQILITKNINYKKYPEYKGRQKSRLEKIGKQYLSILRFQYGIERSKPAQKEAENN